MSLSKKDLLGTENLSRADILSILDTANNLQQVAQRDVKKVPTLRGKLVINLFFESSTRTRTSFEIAGKRLSADVINISGSGTSLDKGESLLDTARNLEAMGPDIIVCRHQAAGVPHWLARNLKASVVNAGDGAHEHPTQALLDLMTIVQVKKRIEGLKVTIVGDIAHSRVARSNIYALQKMGAHVTVVGPPTMIPAAIEKLGVTRLYALRGGVENADVIMMLRIQTERLGLTPFPNLREYARLYGLNKEIMKQCQKDVVIMHPGPINLGVEMDSEIADGPYSVILNQVANGIAIRMAILHLLTRTKGSKDK